MIVLDANILTRAVLGKRVRQLLETYSEHGIRFMCRKFRMPTQRSICPIS